MPERWTQNEMLILAARGLGKVDRDGPRGATLVSQQEVEAMAGALACFGLVPIPPGAAVPDTLIIATEEPIT
ncbi:MAG: hypothetical protein GOVbin2371_15 [Prokaryotic dsDNA virus sp.]|nr:hypothetical protein [Salipiger sp.]QDP47430.1 MAG: hypothetical protein GOVbin2371_15 [Prokaryotic dsDNA virus sp.]|tara:strand:+ start:2252 stop:2467 length:216 start_codon:yes stop_codon:yes gene_type:complete